MKRLIAALAFCYFFAASETSDAAPWLPTPAQVRQLYPELGAADFSAKLQGAADPFHFLRTFVPVYYLLARQNPSEILRPSGALKLPGWCVGDAHPENFGVLLDRSGTPIFSMNDTDDAGPCPMVIDALRYFVAVHLFGKDHHIERLFKIYTKSLNGGPIYFSKTMLNMARWAAGRLDPSKSILKGDFKIRRNESMSDVGRPEYDAIQTLVTLKFGVDARVVDAIRLVRASGGSGGLLRYRFLVAFLGKNPEVHGQDVYLFELKDTQAPGIFPLALGNLGTPESRLKMTVQVEQGLADSQLSIESFMGHRMLLRPRRQGNLGVTLAELKEDEIQDILEDEVALLGRIHIRATSHLAAYRKVINAISPDAWHAEVVRMGELMNATYQTMNHARFQR